MENNVEIFQLLIDSIYNYAIFILDTNGIIKTWSKGATIIKQYTASEAIGKHFSMLYTEEDLKFGKPENGLRIARETGKYEDEFWRVKKDKTQFWCHVRIYPMYNEKNELKGYSKLTRDLSDTRSKEIINESNQAKSQFLASMSHEIRTPMNGVISAANLLAQTISTQEQSELITIIIESGHVLLKVVNDILDFTKMESNEVKLFDECFDLYNELDKITHNFELRVKSEVMFKKIVDTHVPRYVQGDPFRFRQVLTNLIDNAIKFTSRGSVFVDVSSVNNYTTATSMIKVEIIDTGIGIAEKDRDKLFMPYQQLDVTSRQRFKGTGLGLSICKYLTGLMKGRIGVEQNPEGGSIFWFTVYFNISDFEHVRNYPSKELFQLPPKFPNARILLVDDNAINLNVALRILQKLGYVFLETAEDGKEAVEKARKIEYDLIIMDVQMPILDGYKATQKIRKFNKKIPIIAMTANVLEGDSDKCIQSGMNDFIPKPLDMYLLSIVLNRWVYGSF